MNRTLKTFPLVCALVVGGLSATAASARDLVVVELFTSQGCSSCPPADALLTELAERDDLLPLSLHVDYWDYIGWKDPFADPANTQRQRNYARQFGLGYVYTPQVVVDGHLQMTGSNRRTVLGGIERAKDEPEVSVGLKRDGDAVTISLPESVDAEEATVYAVLFDRRHETDVRRGENRGRVLTYSNVVRDMQRIATWRGKTLTLPLPLESMDTDGRDACAVIVQSDRSGRILGAAMLDLES